MSMFSEKDKLPALRFQDPVLLSNAISRYILGTEIGTNLIKMNFRSFFQWQE